MRTLKEKLIEEGAVLKTPEEVVATILKEFREEAPHFDVTGFMFDVSRLSREMRVLPGGKDNFTCGVALGLLLRILTAIAHERGELDDVMVKDA